MYLSFAFFFGRHKHHIKINRCTLKQLYDIVVDNNDKIAGNTLKSAHMWDIKKQINKKN